MNEGCHLAAVSYTHLDVYKRQDMDIKDIKTVDDLRKACPDMVAKIETEAINADVYKRQVRPCRGVRLTLPPFGGKLAYKMRCGKFILQACHLL